MANNRMFLVNRQTGTRIYLAKYYPSTGWFRPNTEDFESAINQALDEEPADEYAMYGDVWQLEYEETTTPDQTKPCGPKFGCVQWEAKG